MLHIIILAAGKGQRMKSSLPKVLHLIANKPMISHVLDTALKLKPQSITVVLGHGSNAVQSVVDQWAKSHQYASIHYAIQSEQLGTGHAVSCALPSLSSYSQEDQVLVLYGDVPCIQSDTLNLLINTDVNHEFSLLTQYLDEPKGYGRIVRKEGQVHSIVEEKDATLEQKQIKEVNTGILSTTLGRLNRYVSQINSNNAQNEYYLTDIIQMASVEGTTIHTLNPHYVWEVQGVNNRQQQMQLERLYQRYMAQNLMNQGVTLIDDSRIDIRGELSCDEDVTIDIGCIFEGQVHLGKGVNVGAYCVIQDAEIGEGTTIAPFTVIQGSKIAENVRIGPFARLRPGTIVDEKARIGNFVELKNTHLGQASKASHLTYLGDAIIGQGVNVGAGVITCNYDGVNKYPTHIGDDVFIGSDVMLVAPVSLGKGSTVGAGTVITQDVPENELVLGRVRQEVISGWERPKKKTS